MSLAPNNVGLLTPEVNEVNREARAINFLLPNRLSDPEKINDMHRSFPSPITAKRREGAPAQIGDHYASQTEKAQER